MNKRIIYPIFAASLAFVMTGCSDDDGLKREVYDSYHQLNLTSAEKSVAERYNEFSVDMLLAQYKANEESGEMLFASLDILASLSVLANGDTDATRDAILREIAGSVDAEALVNVNSLNSKLFDEMPRMQDGTVYKNGATIMLPSDMKLKEAFSSALAAVNGGNAGVMSKKNIDEWVRSVTFGKVQNVPVADSDNAISMYVANGLKLRWGYAVENASAVKGEFYSSTSSVAKTVDMLLLACDDVRYAESDGLKAVKIPLGNGNFTFTGICVDGYKGLRNLSYSAVKTLNYREEDVRLTLPRIDCEDTRDIAPLLKARGLEMLFDASKGMNAVCDRTVTLGGFTSLAVAELTTEGVSASGVADATTRTASRSSLDVTFDRTFIYFIEETSTGVILSAGVYN